MSRQLVFTYEEYLTKYILPMKNYLQKDEVLIPFIENDISMVRIEKINDIKIPDFVTKNFSLCPEIVI